MGDKPIITIDDPVEKVREEINKRLDFHQNIIYAVLVVVAVGFIAIIIAVFAIFIDHQDYAAKKYEEYNHLKKLDLHQQTRTNWFAH